MKVNFTAWINGVYIQSAVASVLSKNAHFPKKPFDLFSNEISEEQRIIESEEAIKRRSKQIDEMLRAAPAGKSRTYNTPECDF